MLKKVAAGQSFSSIDYDELLYTLLLPDPVFDFAFGLGHLPQAKAGDDPVTIVSVQELEHVNALSSEKPLTFDEKGLTIVYGDNGSGKSGYARLLKRITRSRHREQEVLTDVFKDNSLAKPTAKLAIKIGNNSATTIKWPDSSHPELKRMLFFDAPCGEAYVSTESDFPYRPSSLFVLEGLVDFCVAFRDRIDIKLHENAQAAQLLPLVDEQVGETDIGTYFRNLSAFSSLEALDKMLAVHDGLPKKIADLKQEEAHLVVADPAAERQDLIRQMAKLQNLHSHLDNLQRLMSKAALEALQQEQTQLTSLIEQSRVAAESFASVILDSENSTIFLVMGPVADSSFKSSRRFRPFRRAISSFIALRFSLAACINSSLLRSATIAVILSLAVSELAKVAAIDSTFIIVAGRLSRIFSLSKTKSGIVFE